jgi:hypothetical protein
MRRYPHQRSTHRSGKDNRIATNWFVAAGGDGYQAFTTAVDLYKNRFALFKNFLAISSRLFSEPLILRALFVLPFIPFNIGLKLKFRQEFYG